MNISKIGVQWTENIRGAAVIFDAINQFCQSFDRTATYVVYAFMGSAIVVSVIGIGYQIIGIGTAIYNFFSTGRGQI